MSSVLLIATGTGFMSIAYPLAKLCKFAARISPSSLPKKKDCLNTIVKKVCEILKTYSPFAVSLAVTFAAVGFATLSAGVTIIIGYASYAKLSALVLGTLGGLSSYHYCHQR